MSESRRVPKELKVKKVRYITGLLGCIRCVSQWLVVDLNPERKTVKCPICNIPNDIREAMGRVRKAVAA